LLKQAADGSRFRGFFSFCRFFPGSGWIGCLAVEIFHWHSGRDALENTTMQNKNHALPGSQISTMPPAGSTAADMSAVFCFSYYYSETF
jgi:hypothetical protein